MFSNDFKPDLSCKKYYCDICDYVTSKKSNIEKQEKEDLALRSAEPLPKVEKEENQKTKRQENINFFKYLLQFII